MPALFAIMADAVEAEAGWWQRRDWAEQTLREEPAGLVLTNRVGSVLEDHLTLLTGEDQTLGCHTLEERLFLFPYP